jgi:hypothetical protein
MLFGSNFIISHNLVVSPKRHVGWPEDFIANAIQHCRRSVDLNGQGQCLVEKYNGIDSNWAEQRRQVELRPNTMLPDEVVSPVRSIPTGSCPPFKAAGSFLPKSVPAAATTTINATTTTTTASELMDAGLSDANGHDDYPHDDDVRVDDRDNDGCSSCSSEGIFFIVCWFFRCLLSWLL